MSAMARGRGRSPVPHTRSAFERNFSAAATSMKPSTPLSAPIHEPDFGRRPSAFGKTAKRTNGSANTLEKTTIPRTGYPHPPCTVAARRPPTNGTVHENDTSTSVSPMKSTPT